MAQVFRFKDAIIDNYGQSMLQSVLDDLDMTPKELNKYHAISVVNDYSLCGIAYGEYVDPSKFKQGKVTCPDCLDIINYAKSLKKGIDF
jgi:hypothetical protein